jgi:hypothetical protein
MKRSRRNGGTDAFVLYPVGCVKEFLRKAFVTAGRERKT